MQGLTRNQSTSRVSPMSQAPLATSSLFEQAHRERRFIASRDAAMRLVHTWIQLHPDQLKAGWASVNWRTRSRVEGKDGADLRKNGEDELEAFLPKRSREEGTAGQMDGEADQDESATALDADVTEFGLFLADKFGAPDFGGFDAQNHPPTPSPSPLPSPSPPPVPSPTPPPANRPGNAYAGGADVGQDSGAAISLDEIFSLIRNRHPLSLGDCTRHYPGLLVKEEGTLFIGRRLKQLPWSTVPVFARLYSVASQMIGQILDGGRNAIILCTLVNRGTPEQVERLATGLLGHVHTAMRHSSANSLLLLILMRQDVDPLTRANLVAALSEPSEFSATAVHPMGSLALRRLIAQVPRTDLDGLIDVAMQHLVPLSQNRDGNHVLEHLLRRFSPALWVHVANAAVELVPVWESTFLLNYLIQDTAADSSSAARLMLLDQMCQNMNLFLNGRAQHPVTNYLYSALAFQRYDELDRLLTAMQTAASRDALQKHIAQASTFALVLQALDAATHDNSTRTSFRAFVSFSLVASLRQKGDLRAADLETKLRETAVPYEQRSPPGSGLLDSRELGGGGGGGGRGTSPVFGQSREGAYVEGGGSGRTGGELSAGRSSSGENPLQPVQGGYERDDERFSSGVYRSGDGTRRGGVKSGVGDAPGRGYYGSSGYGHNDRPSGGIYGQRSLERQETGFHAEQSGGSRRTGSGAAQSSYGSSSSGSSGHGPVSNSGASTSRSGFAAGGSSYGSYGGGNGLYAGGGGSYGGGRGGGGRGRAYGGSGERPSVGAGRWAPPRPDGGWGGKRGG